MKHTKKERHDIYVRMLKIMENDHSPYAGFCWTLDEVDNEVWIDELPEIIRYKPKFNEVYDLFWFPRDTSGWYKRQFMLMAAIRDTE
jgi:hypothetical protein